MTPASGGRGTNTGLRARSRRREAAEPWRALQEPARSAASFVPATSAGNVGLRARVHRPSDPEKSAAGAGFSLLPGTRRPAPPAWDRARLRAPRSTDATGWNVICSRTSAGTSSRSGALRSGRITSVSPAACAASTFCFSPPIGSTRPCSVTSPVMPTVLFTGRPVSSDASAVTIVTPALGPSFGMAPAGHVHVELAAVEGAVRRCRAASHGSARRSARCAPIPSSRRRAARSAPARRPCRPSTRLRRTARRRRRRSPPGRWRRRAPRSAPPPRGRTSAGRAPSSPPPRRSTIGLGSSPARPASRSCAAPCRARARADGRRPRACSR